MNPITMIIDILFPSFCISCSRPVTSKANHLCTRCRSKIQPAESGCPICSGMIHEGTCEICSDRAFYLSRNFVLAEYSGVMKNLLKDLKFRGMRKLSAHLIVMAVEKLKGHNLSIDIITAVPMDNKKRWIRGYNQSEIIARGIGKLTGWPYKNILRERKGAVSQKELGLRNRFINAIDRYEVLKKGMVQGRCILIIDDVFTTGATLNDCARILREAGSGDVFSLTIARTGIKRLEKI